MAATTTNTRPPRTRAALRITGLALAVGAVVVAAIVAWRVLGQERTVPYTDAQSAGLITLCSADGKSVTEGSVKDSPFVGLVAGATGLPSEYNPDGAVATLFAYQPREGIDPSEFSGVALTATGALADPDHPAVEVTEDVWSVADFVSAFPATFDGYIQLRLILGTPEAGTLTENPYDTADLRVDGDSWELVRGGTASCADASALIP
jgi:hypothetical protein